MVFRRRLGQAQALRIARLESGGPMDARLPASRIAVLAPGLALWLWLVAEWLAGRVGRVGPLGGGCPRGNQ